MGVMAHICNHNIPEKEQEDHEFPGLHSKTLPQKTNQRNHGIYFILFN